MQTKTRKNYVHDWMWAALIYISEYAVQMQGKPHKLSEHLLESLDQMRSIRNLHIQQRQNRLNNEEPYEDLSPSLDIIPQEPNLNFVHPTP